jgi:hypothetical protein
MDDCHVINITKLRKGKKTLILCNVFTFGLQSCDVVEVEINIFFLQNFTHVIFKKNDWSHIPYFLIKSNY